MLLLRRLGPYGLMISLAIVVLILAGGAIAIYLMDQMDKAAITETDLFTAVNQGDMTRVIECLKAKPQFANLKDSKGRTPLRIAAEKDAAETTLLLLKMGADPSLKNDDGKTALDAARDKNAGAALKVLQEKSSGK